MAKKRSLGIQTLHFSHFLNSNSYVVAAFLFPFGIRLIPEIVAGPYPIGYDTIASYVPLMLDWKSGNFETFTPSFGGWLLYAIFGLISMKAQTDPIVVVKTAGPLLYGLLGLSEYYYVREGLGWKRRRAITLVALAAVYFASLRVSLDLFRNMVGLSLFLFALPLTSQLGSIRRAILFAVLAWLVSATHLLVATVLTVLVLYDLVVSNEMRLRRILCIIPSSLQYTLSILTLQIQGVAILSESYPTPERLLTLAFPLYVFLPVLPLAIIGARNVREGALKTWISVCALGVLLGVTPIAVSPSLVGFDRWTYMMTVPLLIYASSCLPMAGWRHMKLRCHHSVFSAWVLLLLILGMAYISLPANNAFGYYEFFVPKTMLQSTVPLEHSENLVSAINWLSLNIRPSSVVMAHNAMYGWIREFFRGNNTIMWFYPGTTLRQGLEFTLDAGFSDIYTIWWADGVGWYGDPLVPAQFSIQYRDGPFGVFYRSGGGT